MNIPIQIDGKLCDEIAILYGEGITQDVVNRSLKVRVALNGVVPIKIVQIPNKLINVVTKPPTGPVYRMHEWQSPDGEWHKSFEPPLPWPVPP